MDELHNTFAMEVKYVWLAVLLFTINKTCHSNRISYSEVNKTREQQTLE